MSYKVLEAFLRDSEERLAGKIIKVAIDRDLCQKKIGFTRWALFEFVKYVQVARPEMRGGKKFSEYLNELELKQVEFTGETKKVTDNLPEISDADWEGYEEFHIEILKKFLDSDYNFPQSGDPPCLEMNGLVIQLYVYLWYQNYTAGRLSGGFFYPTTNARIDFVGLRLIHETSRVIASIVKGGFHQDRTDASHKKKEQNVRARRYYVRQELVKMQRENRTAFQLLSLEQKAKQISISLKPFLEEKKIKHSPETIKSDIRYITTNPKR